MVTSHDMDDLEEMAERIQKHQADRRRRDGSEEFLTIEEPLELDRAILKARTLLATTQERPGIIIDCIPMWVNNMLYYKREKEIPFIIERAIEALPEDAIVVTNEIGWGNIPYDELSRRYNRLVAEVNIRLARSVDHVELLVAGIPVRIK